MKKRWLAVASVVALLLFALFVWRSQQPAYKRYVSPPLPDGTHYTFLYLARFDNIWIKSPKRMAYQEIQMNDQARRSTPMDDSLRRVGISLLQQDYIQSGVYVLAYT